MAKGYKFEYWQKEENRKKIKDWFINGHNKSDVIRYMEIDKSTFYQWQKDHKEFKELIEEAEKIRKEIICDEMEEKLEEKALDFGGDFKCITYYLEHLRPERWGKKREPAFNENDIPKFIDDIE